MRTRILEAARQTGAQAVHPGYGFLSENADFAEACEGAGIAFIGPTAEQIRRFGLKHTSREIAAKCGVPLLPGTGLLATVEEAVVEAERIGFPVMLKSTAGGGGIGMQLCAHCGRAAREIRDGAQSRAKTTSRTTGCFSKSSSTVARHVEVQIFGDGRGNVIALGERDCSTQRRNQKVIEETPAPGLSEEQRAALCESAVRLGREVGYRSAGTVEFVFDAQAGAFYFLEVNTRLQVEHGVTEMVTGTRSRRVDAAPRRRRAAGFREPPARTARQLDPGPHLRGRPRQKLPAQLRSAHRGQLSRERAVRSLDRGRHGGIAILRSAARQADRPRRHARRGDLGSSAKRSRRHASRASRPIAITSRQVVASAAFREGDVFTGIPARLPLSPADHRGARRRARRRPCRITPAGSATGRSACRRAGRWIRSRSVSATGC